MDGELAQLGVQAVTPEHEEWASSDQLLFQLCRIYWALSNHRPRSFRISTEFDSQLSNTSIKAFSDSNLFFFHLAYSSSANNRLNRLITDNLRPTGTPLATYIL